LGILTLGLYWLYYWWTAFRAVDAAAGRRHHSALYAAHLLLLGMSVGLAIATPPPEWTESAGLLVRLSPHGVTGLLAAVLLAAYQRAELRNLHAAREELGLPSTSLALLPWVTLVGAMGAFVRFPGDVLLALGGLLVEVLLLLETNTQVEGVLAASEPRNAPDH
jgi:hypothetical protein